MENIKKLLNFKKRVTSNTKLVSALVVLFQVIPATLILFTALNIVKNGGLIKTDYIAFYTGGKILADESLGAGQLYDTAIQRSVQDSLFFNEYDNFYAYLNPPIVALVASLFSWLALSQFYFATLLINLVLQIIFVFNLKKLFIKTDHYLLFALFAGIFLPVLSCYISGQFSIFLALITLLIILLLKSDKDFRAGILTGLLLIKFHYILLIPFLFVFAKKRKAFLAGSALSILLFIAVNFAIYGSSLGTDYYNLLKNVADSETGTQLGTLITNNVNLQAFVPFVAKFLNVTESLSIKFIAGLQIFLISLALVFGLKNSDDFNRDSVLASSLILFNTLNLHTLYNDLAITFISAVIIFNRAIRTQKETGAILFACAIAVIFLPYLYTLIPQSSLAIGLALVSIINLCLIHQHQKY